MKQVCLTTLLCLLATTPSCSDNDSRPAAIADCEGTQCGGPATGGVTPYPGRDAAAASDAESQDSNVAVVSIQGQIVAFTDETFSHVEPFEGTGSIYVPIAYGDDEVAFDSAAFPAYSATGIVSGGAWFTVQPHSASLNLWMTTHAYLHIPEINTGDAPDDAPLNVDLPILNSNLLTTVFGMIDSMPDVEEDASHVIVVFEKEGLRASGVEVTGYPSAIVAYDLAGGFTTDANKTSTSGMVVLVNVRGSSPLRWKQSNGTTGSLPLVHVAGHGSFVRISLD